MTGLPIAGARAIDWRAAPDVDPLDLDPLDLRDLEDEAGDDLDRAFAAIAKRRFAEGLAVGAFAALVVVAILFAALDAAFAGALP